MEKNKNVEMSMTTKLLIIIPLAIFSIFFILLGLFWLIIIISSTIHNFTYIETTATVVDAKQEDHSSIYYPIYEFEVDGKTVQAEGFSSNIEDIEIGSKHTISYNPKNYKQFDEGKKGNSILFFFIGIIPIIGFLTASIKSIKKIYYM